MPRFAELLDELARAYGEPAPPPSRSLLELILFENVAYLVDDARREQAFAALRTRIGSRPDQILAAPDEALLLIASPGILAANQVDKLRRIALLAQESDLEELRQMPLKAARRALMRFPSIGEPGAEKILLFAHSHAVLGLDSNGVRVLTRLGLVKEAKSYAQTYRAVQQYVEQYADRGFDWLIRAHQLLRQHGQELCRRTTPHCAACPLKDSCAYYATTAGAWLSPDQVSPR